MEDERVRNGMTSFLEKSRSSMFWRLGSITRRNIEAVYHVRRARDERWVNATKPSRRGMERKDVCDSDNFRQRSSSTRQEMSPRKWIRISPGGSKREVKSRPGTRGGRGDEALGGMERSLRCFADRLVMNEWWQGTAGGGRGYERGENLGEPAGADPGFESGWRAMK